MPERDRPSLGAVRRTLLGHRHREVLGRPRGAEDSTPAFGERVEREVGTEPAAPGTGEGAAGADVDPLCGGLSALADRGLLDDPTGTVAAADRADASFPTRSSRRG